MILLLFTWKIINYDSVKKKNRYTHKNNNEKKTGWDRDEKIEISLNDKQLRWRQE